MKALTFAVLFFKSWFTMARNIERDYGHVSIDQEWFWYNEYCYTNNKAPKPYWLWRKTFLFHKHRGLIKAALEVATCEVYGHTYTDHSYADSESGCIDIECSRCGHGWHHILY